MKEKKAALTEGFVIASENKSALGDTEGIDWKDYCNGDLVGDLNPPSWWAVSPWDQIIISPTPEACDSVWPCLLFKVAIPPGTPALDWDDGRVRASGVLLWGQVDSRLVLGPQRDELIAMTDKLNDITAQQQQALLEFENGDALTLNQAHLAVRAIAVAAGRHNSTAVHQLMWHERPGIWSRTAIANAAMAVAHRDLLEEQDLWNLHGEVLYRPWREVMAS